MQQSPDIHHRKSIRLKGYDYSQAGAYFITICTNNRELLFGEVKNGKMLLNEYGVIAYKEWKMTEEMRKDIILDEFVIMPNHIHGIIVMNCRGAKHRARTMEEFGKPTSNTIPTIVRGYKSSVTVQINKLRGTLSHPVWQRNYYEHIVRNEISLNAIREYIINNPINWQKDELFRL